MVPLFRANPALRGRTPHRMLRLSQDNAATAQACASVSAMHLPGKGARPARAHVFRPGNQTHLHIPARAVHRNRISRTGNGDDDPGAPPAKPASAPARKLQS
eukprot:4021561-Pleurochrysis_carterae.AAC.1